MRSYEGEKGHQFFKEQWIVELEEPVELFLMVSISEMTTTNYWQDLKKMDNAKENPLKMHN